MADCTIIGDSIAIGLGQALAGRCEVRARVGAGATEAGAWATGSGGLLIVALGTNGPTPAALQQTLRSIAATAQRSGQSVVWVLPVREPNRSLVARAAAARGEPALSFAPGHDGFHPRSYNSLAARAIGGGR